MSRFSDTVGKKVNFKTYTLTNRILNRQAEREASTGDWSNRDREARQEDGRKLCAAGGNQATQSGQVPPTVMMMKWRGGCVGWLAGWRVEAEAGESWRPVSGGMWKIGW